MKRSLTILMVLAGLFALNSVSLAQKTKSKPKVKTKSTKTTPPQNPGYIGETEKNLSKSKPTSCKNFPVNSPSWIECHEFEVAVTGKSKRSSATNTPSNSGTNPAVFEPNDEPRSNASLPGATTPPRKPGKIMDIVDMAKADGQSPSQPNPQAGKTATPKNGVAPASKAKGTKNFNDIIVSSKTTKPKSKPVKSKTSKPKP